MANVQQAKIGSPNVVNFNAITSGGDFFTNTGREVVLIQADGTHSVTVAITPAAKLLGAVSVLSPSYLVNATNLVAIGPFDPASYNGNINPGGTAASASQVAINYTTSGTPTIMVLQLPQPPL